VLSSAAKIIPVILLILTIHEYGHYSEMKKNNVEVQEFSIGIGKPLFQYYREDGVLVSFRLVPIVAYVLPSDEGHKKINTLPFIKSFSIHFAGVRNNIFTGWALVVGMQFLSVVRRHNWPDFFKNFLFSPIKILILFFGFTMGFFHELGAKIVEKYQFTVYGIKENEHINRILWWSFVLSFLNFLPIGNFDGRRIFFEVVLKFTSNTEVLNLLSFVSSVLFFSLLFIGIRIGELVDYID
jgi:membrane-associated protease RseP (regulator of RpoE activity)